MALIETHEKAARLARAIASDILLYNQEKIVEGLKKDTFFDLMALVLEEGRQLYRSRVSPRCDPSANFFNRAVVDVIIAGSGKVETRIWQ